MTTVCVLQDRCSCFSYFHPGQSLLDLIVTAVNQASSLVLMVACQKQPFCSEHEPVRLTRTEHMGASRPGKVRSSSSLVRSLHSNLNKMGEHIDCLLMQVAQLLNLLLVGERWTGKTPRKEVRRWQQGPEMKAANQIRLASLFLLAEWVGLRLRVPNLHILTTIGRQHS